MDASEGEFLKEAEKKRKRVYSDKNNGDIRSNGIKEAQKTLLSLLSPRIFKKGFTGDWLKIYTWTAWKGEKASQPIW